MGNVNSQVNYGRLARGSFDMGRADIDIAIGEASQDISQHAHAVDDFQLQLHWVGLHSPCLSEFVPADGQKAIALDIGDIGTIVLVDGNTAIAAGNHADDGIAGQGFTTASQVIHQPLHPVNRSLAGFARGFGLGERGSWQGKDGLFG
jgi:hypothetical protein